MDTKLLIPAMREYGITSPFGWRLKAYKPAYKGQPEWHTGIDLVKPANAPVSAFVAGIVTFAKEVPAGVSGTGYGGFGLVVAVKDKNGYTHMYAHLSKAKVNVGDKVTQGQVIGNQGSTGNSTGQHVHYEVRQVAFGTEVDPVAYLYAFFNGKTLPVHKAKPAMPSTIAAFSYIPPSPVETSKPAEEKPAPPKQPEGVITVGQLLEWQKQAGIDALDVLHKEGLVNNPEEWKTQLDKPVPNWLFFTLLSRMSQKK